MFVLIHEVIFPRSVVSVAITERADLGLCWTYARSPIFFLRQLKRKMHFVFWVLKSEQSAAVFILVPRNISKHLFVKKIVNVPTWGGCTKIVSSLTAIFLTPLSCRSFTARLMSSNSVCMSARVSFSPSSKHIARVLRCLPVNWNCKMMLGVVTCKHTLRRTQNSMAQHTPSVAFFQKVCTVDVLDLSFYEFTQFRVHHKK